MNKRADTRSGFAALIGAPNAGKSTLTNQLVGAKVSIVTHKVQTTRARVRGVVMVDGAQIVLVDTPGIFKPRRMLDRAMVRTAWAESFDADAVVLLIDAQKGICEETAAIIETLKTQQRQVMIAINKIDRVRRETLLSLAEQVDDSGVASEIYMISALNGDGVEDLRDTLAGMMPLSAYLFPEDQLSDMPQRLLAAEVTREKLFLRLHQELPYATTIETEQWSARNDGSVRIDQTIYVDRASQKPIVLGKGGRTIKQIGQESRIELEELLGIRIHLFVHVKVREGWGDERARLAEIGLDTTDL